MFKKKILKIDDAVKKRKLGRIYILLCAFVFSLSIAALLLHFSPEIVNLKVANPYEVIFFRGVLYSLSPLPLFFFLWLFRHTDTQDNLAKQQQNINQSALFEAQRLILEPDNAKKSIAIEQLKTLFRDVPEFRDSIYIALKVGLQDTGTREGSNEFIPDLAGANFQGADLRGINWRNAELSFADLRNAWFETYDSIFDNGTLNIRWECADLRGALLKLLTWETDKLSNVEDALLPVYNDYTSLYILNTNPDKNIIAAIKTDRKIVKDKLLNEYRLLHEEDLTKEMRQKRKEYSKQIGLTKSI